MSFISRISELYSLFAIFVSLKSTFERNNRYRYPTVNNFSLSVCSEIKPFQSCLPIEILCFFFFLNVPIDRGQRLSNMANGHLWTLPCELSRFRVPTITYNYTKLRTLRALSTAFMPHEITFGSNEPETDWGLCGR